LRAARGRVCHVVSWSPLLILILLLYSMTNTFAIGE
jgi:hypothetical protein